MQSDIHCKHPQTNTERGYIDLNYILLAITGSSFKQTIPSTSDGLLCLQRIESDYPCIYCAPGHEILLK